MADLDAKKYIDRNSFLETEKQPFTDLYQRLAEWFLTRKQDFQNELTAAAFLYSDIYDNAGEHAALVSASALQSMIWPDAARSFVIEPVDELRGRPGVDEYFRTVTSRVQRAMDNPKSGLALALPEHFIDGQVFGISGLSAMENDDEDEVAVPVIYDQWDIKSMCIEEDAKGFVSGIYFKRQFTIGQMVEDYSKPLDKIHPEVMKKYAEGKRDEKITVLKVIEVRPKAERAQRGTLAGPIRTLHIDATNKFIMREGGDHEMPVFVVRAMKAGNEKYARSSAMVAFPDVVSLNALKEARIRATEKQLDPPMVVLDDGRVGGAVIDSSAGGVTVLNTSGRAGEKPIFPLFTVGEMQSSEKLEQEFKDGITQAFLVDRLLDLNNQTQMTAYEASIRNRMRGDALSSRVAREETEGFIPLIERTVSIMFRKDLLGVDGTGIVNRIKRLWDKVLGREVLIVPKDITAAVKEGLEVYRVRFISPATRFMQAEKLQGIFTIAEFAEKAVGAFPGIEDNFDPDVIARKAVEYSGAPIEINRTEEAVTEIRKVRAQQAELATKLEAAKQASEIARNAGQAKMASAAAGGVR